ncbi:MAG: HAD family phosphatase [archaeon]
MITTIMFDIGGVLLDMRPILEKAAEFYGVKGEGKPEFWKIINMESLPACRGEMSGTEFLKKLNERMGKDVNLDLLKAIFVWNYAEMVKVNESVKEIALELKKNYKIVALTNAIQKHKDIVVQQGWFDFLEGIIASVDAKMTKDNPEFFKFALDKLNLKPEEVLFIDDIQAFVDIAKSLGMNAVLFENSEKLKEDLKGFGVELD